ncbi:hypothetical protein BD779DRAFT_1789067 [Infundibulicybe gibba]|nr:hypothetical protein BD779DRAFT_1789067 [Infundibulicybe gibba]
MNDSTGPQDYYISSLELPIAKLGLEMLQNGLASSNGIRAPPEVMDKIMMYVDAGAMELDTAMEKQLVSKDDLSNLGLERRRLIINQGVLAQRLEDNAAYMDQIKRLCKQVNDTHRLSDIRSALTSGAKSIFGARVIFDTILLTVTTISRLAGVPTSIFPEFRAANDDGISVVNPTTGYQLQLDVDVDYVLFTYTQESCEFHNAYPDEIIRRARNCLALVKRKYEDQPLFDSMPEAISQAMALSEARKKNTALFVLSDSQNWVFSLLAKDEKGNWVCYEGEVFSIIETPDADKILEEDVHKVVALVNHWLIAKDDPFADPLYTLQAMEE